MFGDITTGRVWYADRADVLAADDGNPTTVAPIHEIDAGLRRLAEETYRKRGGKGETLPGMGAMAGRGRVDLRFASDNDGELYVLTKSDGMIRKVVGARARPAPRQLRRPDSELSVTASPTSPPPASEIRCRPRPKSIAAGKRAYDANCAACHGNMAQGAVKAGIDDLDHRGAATASSRRISPTISGITARATATSSASSSAGLPPTMMAGFDGRIPDADIWSIVNYLRSLHTRK